MILANLTSERRSKNINTQIILSFFLKFLSISLGFVIIPKTLNILGNDQYGVWLTILSVVSWIVSFDVGIGNGLRNKLTESLSLGEYESSCKYISTAYCSLALIGLTIIIVASAIFPFINWHKVFNTTVITNNELRNSFYVITIAVIINFVIIIVNQVMNAFQKTALTNMSGILHSSLFLIMLLCFKVVNNLYLITCLYSLSLIISGVITSFIFYRKRMEYIPKLKWFDISKVKDILKLGGGFFIIQIATLVMFSLTSMLIIQLLTAKDVAIYNVTFRLFSTLTLAFSIIVTPYWSAFTEAYKKSDFLWIKSSLNRLQIFLGITFFFAIVLICFHQNILDLWLGKSKVKPGVSVAFMMALYSIVLNWSNIYSHYLNGIGKIRVQTVVAVVQALLVIPLCLIFTKYFDFGLVGIMLSLVICMVPFAIIGPAITYRNLRFNTGE